MKCVVNVYDKNGNERENIFDVDKNIVEDLDEIANSEGKSSDTIIVGLLEEYVESKKKIR